jgi:putative colanic acid biosynthesis UDP-glucose lipid carrier transferase
MTGVQTLLKVLDPVIIAATGLLSYLLRFDNLEVPGSYRVALLAGVGLAILVFGILDVYRWRPDEGFRRDIGRVFTGWFVLLGGLVFLLYATKTGSEFSRQWFGVWAVAGLLGLILVRLAVRFALRFLRRRGGLERPVAIAGAGALGQEIAQRFARSPELGFRVAAFFDDAPDLRGTSVHGIPVAGTLDDVAGELRRQRIDQVWIALPLRAEERIHALLRDLAPQNVKLCFVPDIYGFQLLNHSFTEICGLPVVNVTESPFAGLKGTLKWLEDKVIALIVLGLIWPLLLAIALGVKMTSPGPAIFRQRRGGLDNREIVVWKFRTMTVHDEQAVGDVPQARRHDPRVTSFGAFLRRTSLDELPQFINVLTGDMSIVGPRPHPLWLNEFHRDKIPRYMLRSWIKPGITGWAQICGWRGETDELWKMEMRVQHDLYYIEHWSVGFDLYIILMTIFRLRSPQAY